MEGLILEGLLFLLAEKLKRWLEELILGGLLFLLVKIIVIIVSLSFYYIPTIIGIIRKKKDIIAIAVLNTFLGWSLVGWVISLVWALKKDS